MSMPLEHDYIGLTETSSMERSSEKISSSWSAITVSEYSSSKLIFNNISDPFGFAVKRKSDGQVLFNSSSDPKDPYGELVFKDQYLEISTVFKDPTSAQLVEQQD
ncbi:hypothetical protein PRUPE_2G076500 [Prunus persica]|uniref:Uncharacterized protein n=1 Tax=Prunus persica TaxID=3760 RepID=A0A251QCQ1_PRUPE|nr:hypothetical protein PRUPE_2G076500 [Prunus persica]